MALTLANATTEVRDLLNEDQAAFFADSEIQNWIKEGTRIFSAKSLLVEGDDSITLVASQLSYGSGDHSWIGDCMEIYTALHYNATTGKYKGLRKEHTRQIGNSANFTAGVPKAYSMHNRNIYVTPMTTAARVTAGDTILVLYAKETDDITEVKDEHQHLPIIYACAKCKQKDQKFAEATSLFNQFYQELAFERADKHGREEDTLDMFKVKSTGGEAGAK